MTQTSQQLQTMSPTKDIKHTKFTEEEDQQLRSLVAQFGSNDWDNIAAAMSGRRTKRQLRERWQNYVNPDLLPFYTEVEDGLLVALYNQVGPQWAKIAAVIGKKSAISTRNRYRSLQSMKARGVKPDYEKTEVWNEITEMNRMESTVLEVPDINFMMEERWECEFEGFF
jgi:preprotein translocase subunit SecA